MKKTLTRVLFSSVILISCLQLGFTNAPQGRFYMVPNQYLAMIQGRSLALAPLAVTPGFSLLRLTPEEVQSLSEEIHHRVGICGGFSDIQVQAEQRGMTLAQALEWQAHGPSIISRFEPRAPQYPNEVKRMLSGLSADRWAQTLNGIIANFEDRSAYTESGKKFSLWLGQFAQQLGAQVGRNDIQVINIPTGGGYKQDSVVIRLPGADPKEPGVLLGGHMDTFEKKPGADDDGSGTTTVLELLTATVSSGLKFKRDIYFAFYAAEERGLVGSQRVVKEFEARRITLKGVLQYDMTGFDSPRDPQELFLITDNVNPDLTRFLSVLAQKYLGITPDRIGQTSCGYACSDHASWHRAGYPAAFPFEASFNNMNRTLHTDRDVMANISVPHAMKFVALGAAFIVELGDPIGQVRPLTWN
ncbi:MAG: M20/M25/M40 family metallo-hydrolase [Oligoflexia bacterium]|nr:M20/M25/M40 family metallo-hydrolase [Oligoflexia bacterium]